ncbi:hypothetical protein [Magnetospirillum sp. 64-120]|uniref:hypothetical protein n=1 Tax=Magnetospirillum sp. 64-120 TaxID=1895778 RepID=UPI000ADB7124|nr:hypothetical protein [Magnetospirillum sp. 64-120]
MSQKSSAQPVSQKQRTQMASAQRPRNGLLSRIAAPIASVARRMKKRGQIDDMSPEEAEREIEMARRAAQNAASDSLTDDDFRLAMEQVLREDQGRFGTKLHVVSLVEFREAVGERWAKVSDKVMMIAEGVITKHLGAGNLFSRQGTDFFTLVFRTCSADEGRLRAHTIAQELGTRLVGDQFQGVERPLALSAEMDLTDAVLPDGSLNHAAIQRAVGEKRALIAAAIADDTSKAWTPPASPPVARKPASPDLPHAVTGADKVKQAQDPGWVTMDTPKRIKETDTAWIILDTGPKPEPQAVAAPAIMPSAPPLTDASRLTLLWRPTWVSQPETIGAYVARVQRLDKPDGITLDGVLAYPRDDENSTQTLDRYCIGNAMRDFRASENAGNGSSVVIPIHWATLAAENRMDILAPFADIPETVRQNRVIIDLFGIPEQVSARVLMEAVAIARPLCRSVALRTRLTDSRAKLAADSGVAMIGVDLAQLSPAERADDATLLGHLRRYWEQAQGFGLKTYLWGVRRRAVVVGAVQGGFAMVNGPALMKDIAKPSKVLPAPRSRFAATSSG